MPLPASVAGISRVAAPAEPRARRGSQTIWLYLFVVTQFMCQLMLLVPAFVALRAIVRTVAFALSLVLLVGLPGRSRGNLARKSGVVALAIVLIEFMHPDGGGVLVCLAQFAMYLAILAPIFWVPRIDMTAKSLERLVLMLWLFYSASSALGVLQAYFPGRFQPPISTVILDQGKEYLRSLEIELMSGQHVLRPMGLSDVPGGAAYAGLYAVVLGMSIVQAPRPFWGARPLAVGSMILGMMCLYLCQVRAVLIMTGVCVATLVAFFAITGRVSRLLVSTLVITSVVLIGLVLALDVAGRSVMARLTTLVASDPGTVYYANRGRFLEYTINDLVPMYPMGAGLGHWGMSARYFGSEVRAIWVEIQWTGWLLDGGIPLILAYAVAIGAATWQAWGVARSRSRDDRSGLSIWAALIVAYNVGAIALTFSYPLFIGAGGMEFWLLNAALWSAAQRSESV